jgi:hypothetical protein
MSFKTSNSVGMNDNCFGPFVLFQVQNKNKFFKIKNAEQPEKEH